jgi:hypothetical protein
MRKATPVLILLVAACAARADIIYNDQASWLSALSGAPTTVNFEGLAPPGGASYIGSGAGANTTVGGINFAVGPSSNGNLFIIGDNLYYPGTAAISSQESTTAFNDLLITLPFSVTAVGFSFGDFFGDTATITLSDGTVSFPTATPIPYLGFFGATAPGGAINWVDITTPDQVMNVASVSYGFATTPEPAAPLLLATMLGLAALLLRKHIRA